MNKIKRFLKLRLKIFMIILPIVFLLVSCDFNSQNYVKILQDSPIEISIGSSFQLDYECSSNLKEKESIWKSNSECIQIDESGLIIAKDVGTAVVTLKVDNYSDSINVHVIDTSIYELELSASKYDIYVGENIKLNCRLNSFEDQNINDDVFNYQITYGREYADLNNDILIGKGAGIVRIIATYGNINSNEIVITIHERTSEEILTLSASKYEIYVGEVAELTCDISIVGNSDMQDIVYEIIEGEYFASIYNNLVTGLSSGQVNIVAKKGDIISNTITIKIIDASITQKIELRASKYYLSSGESAMLIATKYPESATGKITYEITKGKYYISLSGANQIIANSGGGIATIVAKCGNIVSNEIEITTVKGSGNPTNISLTSNKQICGVGDFVTLDYAVTPISASKNIEFIFNFGDKNAYIIGNKIYITNDGPICIVGKIGNVYSNEILINETSIGDDPYKDITEQEFYSNYSLANNYIDAYYRSLHGFMSGSIELQKQEPTLSKYMPKENGIYLRNSSANYSADGNTYYVIDSYGNIVNEIYKGGGYVTLEEVAAYIFAFGEVPANYTERKTADPNTSIWGKYLRLNNTYFSGDTIQYPYEPVLPNIRGCGGELYYYEVDIGTTGTNCDPKYPPANYNNGYSISRGAARIVYTRYDANGDKIIDVNEKYLFYTYNHYNDFQEYLNYQGGWGEMFGNITGGGEISSSTNYNPTSYVQVIFKNFTDNSSYHMNVEYCYALLTQIKRKEFLFGLC